jgi:hypothetical protein
MTSSFESETRPLLTTEPTPLDARRRAKKFSREASAKKGQELSQRLEAAFHLAGKEAIRGAKAGYNMGQECLVIPIPVTTPLGAAMFAMTGFIKGYVRTRNEQKSHNISERPSMPVTTASEQALFQQ